AALHGRRRVRPRAVLRDALGQVGRGRADRHRLPRGVVPVGEARAHAVERGALFLFSAPRRRRPEDQGGGGHTRHGGGGAAAPPDFLPPGSGGAVPPVAPAAPRMWNSTRRFFWRPSVVLLSAIGRFGP